MPQQMEELRLRAVVETAVDGVILIDAQGCVQMFNPACEKLFGYSEPHATKLMLQVHNEGRAVVSAGTREAMEVDVAKLHAAGLWASSNPGASRSSPATARS